MPMAIYVVRLKTGHQIRIQAASATASKEGVIFMDESSACIAAFSFDGIFGWWLESAEQHRKDGAP
jgi:ABC-type phosphate transport system ATPase subunit